MEERPLVLFTLLLQAAVGAAWVFTGLEWWLPAPPGALSGPGWNGVAALALLGTLASFAHLGVPANAWRAASNWRTSWLSREILCAGVFTGAALAAALAAPAGWPGVAVMARMAALATCPLLLHCMAKAYRLATVPAWDRPITPLAFFSTALLLGVLCGGVLLVAASGLPPEPVRRAWSWLAGAALVLTLGHLGLTALWLARLPEEVRSVILVRHARLFKARLALAGGGAAAAALLLAFPGSGLGTWELRLAALGAIAGSEALARTLFYAGQVPQGVYLNKG